MNRKIIIKSINENLEQLPHKAYIWNRGFPRVKILDEITKKEIFIEIHALRYPITQTKGVLYTVLFAFTPHIIETTLYTHLLGSYKSQLDVQKSVVLSLL